MSTKEFCVNYHFYNIEFDSLKLIVATKQKQKFAVKHRMKNFIKDLTKLDSDLERLRDLGINISVEVHVPSEVVEVGEEE